MAENNAHVSIEGEAKEKTTQERLNSVVADGSNRSCADCGEPNPAWASILKPPIEGGKPVGVLCCSKCYILHEKLGKNVCEVKSMSFAAHWTAAELKALEESGNQAVNDVYEAKLNKMGIEKVEVLRSKGKDMETFVGDKYLRRLHFSERAYRHWLVKHKKRKKGEKSKSPRPKGSRRLPSRSSSHSVIQSQAGDLERTHLARETGCRRKAPKRASSLRLPSRSSSQTVTPSQTGDLQRAPLERETICHRKAPKRASSLSPFRFDENGGVSLQPRKIKCDPEQEEINQSGHSQATKREGEGETNHKRAKLAKSSSLSCLFASRSFSLFLSEGQDKIGNLGSPRVPPKRASSLRQLIFGENSLRNLKCDLQQEETSQPEHPQAPESEGNTKQNHQNRPDRPHGQVKYLLARSYSLSESQGKTGDLEKKPLARGHRRELPERASSLRQLKRIVNFGACSQSRKWASDHTAQSKHSEASKNHGHSNHNQAKTRLSSSKQAAHLKGCRGLGMQNFGTISQALCLSIVETGDSEKLPSSKSDVTGDIDLSSRHTIKSNTSFGKEKDLPSSSGHDRQKRTKTKVERTASKREITSSSCHGEQRRRTSRSKSGRVRSFSTRDEEIPSNSRHADQKRRTRDRRTRSRSAELEEIPSSSTHGGTNRVGRLNLDRTSSTSSSKQEKIPSFSVHGGQERRVRVERTHSKRQHRRSDGMKHLMKCDTEEAPSNERGGRLSLEGGDLKSAGAPRGRRVDRGNSFQNKRGRHLERQKKSLVEEEGRMVRSNLCEESRQRRSNVNDGPASSQAALSPGLAQAQEKPRDSKLDRIIARRQGNRRFGRPRSTGEGKENGVDIDGKSSTIPFQDEVNAVLEGLDVYSSEELTCDLEGQEEDEDEKKSKSWKAKLVRTGKKTFVKTGKRTIKTGKKILGATKSQQSTDISPENEKSDELHLKACQFEVPSSEKPECSFADGLGEHEAQEESVKEKSKSWEKKLIKTGRKIPGESKSQKSQDLDALPETVQFAEAQAA